ncbi:MAG: response regulator transcription factor [Nitrospirae bacterium]|nr:response regulator transcription factor [Nitrospirota bacterium]MBI3593726.1 response regulator transcription factor [Nitrospirota bacterium]
MINILIADDHAVVRQGIKNILQTTSDLKVAGEAGNGQEVMKQVRSQSWNVVVLDMAMPGKTGLDLLKEIKGEQPDLPVLVLSMHSEDQYAVRLLRAGASGYMTKESAPDDLINAIRKVAGGGKYISSCLAEQLVQDLRLDSEKPFHELLSDREYQVMCLIAEGKSIKQIAEQMVLSIKTVSTYRSRILEKMKMKTNADLIQYGIRNKLVD